MIPVVIGADAQIGQALLAAWKTDGVSAYGTTRRRDALDTPRRLQLDLTTPPQAESLPRDIAAAVFCAGITSTDQCRAQPRETWQVNVTATLRWIEYLLERDVFVVFLSTNQVFDGATPHCPADAPLSPQSEYGHQKAAVEDRLRQFKRSVAVVRLTKVLTPLHPRLTQWVTALRAAQPIQVPRDLRFAPLPAWWVVRRLQQIVQRRLPGVWQFSAREDWSYFAAAQHIAAALVADPELVRAFNFAELPHSRQPPPLHTTLDTSRLQSELDLTVPPIADTLHSAAGLHTSTGYDHESHRV